MEDTIFCACQNSRKSPSRIINNNKYIMFLYSAYHIQMASLCARGIITPALALIQPFSAKSIRRNKFLLGTHLLHLGRERQLGTKCLVYMGVRTKWNSNPPPSDCKPRARTTTPQCSHYHKSNVRLIFEIEPHSKNCGFKITPLVF